MTSIVPFGAFARLEEGLDGLIHISELTVPGHSGGIIQRLAEGQALTGAGVECGCLSPAPGFKPETEQWPERLSFAGSWMKKAFWLVLLGVMAGLLGAGILCLVSRPPHGEAIQLLPAPTITAAGVYVTGAVAAPGVYSLPPGSRVADALDAAGGIDRSGEPQSLNLAQVLTDGQRIHVLK